MEMDKENVYVVTYGGTPLMVTWGLRSAVEFIEDMNDDDIEKYCIHKVLMQNPYLWIKQGMEMAEKQPAVPNWSEALDWMVSEVGEAVGARVANQNVDWVRNNPENHVEDSVDWEVGQAIMMGILALGSNPMGIIRAQLKKWGYEEPEFEDDSERYYDMLFNFPRGE